jgi:hypothetical protein
MDVLYPEWRDESGEWLGVKYDSPAIAQRVLGVHPYIARALNWLHGVSR